MPPPFPYTFYACPCAEQQSNSTALQDDDEQDRTLDPHDPRSAFSLYTLDHLLFCDECNRITCDRCVNDETFSHYCPNCLFETPTDSVKSDGNRCARSCYCCPLCTSTLTVNMLESEDGKTEEETYIMSCAYCAWSTLDIGIRFSKPTNISRQLKAVHKERLATAEALSNPKRKTPALSFQKLEDFYQAQLVESAAVSDDYKYSSPANLARIISLYGGLPVRKAWQRNAGPMREPLVKDGLVVYDADSTQEDDIVDRISELGWDGTTSSTQRQALPMNLDARSTQDLWPVPMPLKLRRGKRCRQCRQFVTRPEHRPMSSKYRVRIIAMNHIPRLSIRPLDDSRNVSQHSFRLKQEPVTEPLLQPHITQQFVLTLRNPIFESVKVTLATSAITPGRVATKVTILCPSFTIGPAGNVWDEALSTSVTSGQGDGGRRAAMASLTGTNEADRQPEAGKVWEQTRNSTSVVLEIVPGSLNLPPSIVPTDGTQDEHLQEGDDVLEIPIHVRAQWIAEVELQGEQKGMTEKVAKELEYWCVLGVGRIAP